MHSSSHFFCQVMDSIHGRISGTDGFQIVPVLVKPNSRGHVKLASSNPAIKPLIDPNYLNSEQDIKTLIEGRLRSNKLIVLINW